jgi:hypothetical protein
MNAPAFVLSRTDRAAPAPRILPMDEPLPSSRPASLRSHAARRLFADACYVALRFAGWLAVTSLAAMGIYVLFFLALGNMSADGFFAQLANLGNRFTAADTLRRDSFLSIVGTVSTVLFLIVATARFRSLLAIFVTPAPARKDRP